MKDQKELLKDFFLFFRDKGTEYIGLTIEQFIDEYLKTKKWYTSEH